MRKRRADGGVATGDRVDTDNDEDLVERARHGDRSAFGTLYLRHRAAARRVARRWAVSAADADDAVAEAFAKVFAVLPRKAKGEVIFRRYLFTAVRNAATDRIRGERRIDLGEAIPEAPADDRAEDPTLLGLERDLLAEALQGLPARWRTMLWLTEVEGLTPAEVAQQYHMTPNAVAAVAYRARKGLRKTYLQAHLRLEPSERCRDTVGRLGEYVLGGLEPGNRGEVDAHLQRCLRCKQRSLELVDVSATLRRAVAPIAPLLSRMTELPSWAMPSESSRPLQKAVAGVAATVLALAAPAGDSAPTAPMSTTADSVAAAAPPPSAPAAARPSVLADGRKGVGGVLEDVVPNHGPLPPVLASAGVHLDAALPLDGAVPLGLPAQPELGVAAVAVASDALGQRLDRAALDLAGGDLRTASVTQPVSLPEAVQQAQAKAAASAAARLSQRLGSSKLELDGFVIDAVRRAEARRGAARGIPGDRAVWRPGTQRGGARAMPGDRVWRRGAMRGAGAIPGDRATLVARRLPTFQPRSSHPVRGRYGR